MCKDTCPLKHRMKVGPARVQAQVMGTGVWAARAFVPGVASAAGSAGQQAAVTSRAPTRRLCPRLPCGSC